MTVTVAYLGPAGTFTEAALWKFHEQTLPDVTVQPLPVDSPAMALDAVRSGDADYACVAIENSVDGPVTPTFDALAAAPGVQIYGETDIDITFAIMMRPEFDSATIRTFSTHPVARQQVADWVADNLPEVDFIPASSNAAAAQAVAEGRVDAAAAPERAADLFNLEVVARDIADVRGAHTRFVLVGRSGVPCPRTGDDRTSVVFNLPQRPGTLVGALTEFALRGVDLSRIESRPTRTNIGTYRFHVDLNGHIDDAPLAEAISALYLRCDDLTYLGSWPAARREGEQVRNNTVARIAEAHAWVERMRRGDIPERRNPE